MKLSTIAWPATPLTSHLIFSNFQSVPAVSLKNCKRNTFQTFRHRSKSTREHVVCCLFSLRMAIMIEIKSSKRSFIVLVRFPDVVSSNEISNLQIEEDQSVNFTIIGFQWSWYGKILKDFQRPLICTCFNWSKFETWVFSQLNAH